MSQWNLSVRLDGQGSGLARTLRDTSRDARAASRDVNALRRDISRLRAEASRDIRLGVRIDAGRLRQDIRAAIRTADTGNGIRIPLRVDGAHLRSEVRAALTSAGPTNGLKVRLDLDAGHLRADVQAALRGAGSGQGLAVNLRIADTMRLRREVQAAVRWAAWGHRIEIPIGLRDPNQLRRDVSAAVRRAQQNQTIRIRVTADTSALRSLTRGLGPGGGGGGGGGGAGGMLGGLLTLAPAAIPLAAGLVSTMAPLAGEFAAAGAAGAAFGIAVAGQVEALTAASDAAKKYEEAVVKYGAGSQQAAEAALAYQQQVESMPPATQRAAAAVTVLKDDFSAWSDEMSQFTMEPVTKGIAVLDELIPSLTPEVKSFSTQLDRVITVAGGAISTPGFDRLEQKFANFTDAQLDALTDQVIHFMRVVSEGDADGGALGAILDYARENGPAAREAIRAISQAVITLVQGAAQAGPGMLALVTAAAKLVAALPPELVGIIIGVASALKLLQLSGAGMAALAAGVTRVQASITALAATSAAAGGGLAGLRAAFLSLGTAAKASIVIAGIAAVVLVLKNLSEIGQEAPPNVDKMTTSLGNLGRTGKVTGEALRSFGGDLSGLGDSLRTLSRPSNLDKTQQFLTSLVGMDSTPVKDAKENLDAVDESLANLVKGGKADLAKEAFGQIAKAMRKQGLSSKELKSHLDSYKQALADQKFEQELAAASMGIFGKAAADTTRQMAGAKAAADGLRASILALNEANRSAYDAQIGFESAIDDLTASFKENGSTLDINTDKGRKNGQAMSAAAKAHDEMLASGLAAGESMGSMTKKSEALRSQMMKLATASLGSKAAAEKYVNTLLGAPGEIKTVIKLERQEAITGLREVQSAITKTPGAKRITVSTLNAAAIHALEAVGLKTKQLPNGKTAVYTANGQSLGSISAVRRAMDALNGKRADTYTTHHVLTIRETRAVYSTVGRPSKGEGGVSKYADGGLVHHAARGLFVPGYAPRVDKVRAMLSPGEGVLVPETVAKLGTSTGLGRAGVIEALNQWGRYGRTDTRLVGMNGAVMPGPDGISRFADGGLSFTYQGTGGSAQKYTLSGLISASNDKKGNFSLAIFQKKLAASNNALAAWRSDLAKVASRAGQDVADALADMGDEGIALTKKMAHGSSKYVKEMAAELKKLSNAAKASLGEYTSQLKDAVKDQSTFQANLAKLAAQGYGDLAGRLAGQGDQAAEELAAAAVKDKKKAASANSAAKAANNALSGDQLEQLVQIIAAITSAKTGIHDVAATTSLGEDVIIEVANKAKAQITSSLGGRAAKFLADLGKANQHLAYADGGIRSGIYATRGGAVTFAEPSTGGEAFIPLGANKRRSALPVLSDVASRFGVGLTDARTGRVVNQYFTTSQSVTSHVSGVGNPRDVARRVDENASYQLRRLARGGVAAR